MDLNAYLTAARAARGLSSDNQLARALDLSSTSLHHIRHGRQLPSDETMVRIAETADQDIELALLRLNYWRARHGRARDAYKSMLAKAGAAAIFALFVVTGVTFMAPRPALVLAENVRMLYIMENI